MINALIFSKDRAPQLRLLLESILFNSYKILDKITIIYTSSHPKFAQGYSKLIEENLGLPTPIIWKQEKDIIVQTQETLDGYRGANAFTTFFMDDNVFFKPIHSEKFTIESALHPTSDIACFSLRIGLNTKEETYWQLGNHVNFLYTQVKDLLKWRHVDYAPNASYGYPMSLDGHIFRSNDIADFVRRVGTFTSVNGLEGALGRFRGEIQPTMCSFAHSVLVNVPINRVQNSCPNVSGLYYGMSEHSLNNAYLAGQVIDYNSIDFSKIIGTHQELKYTLRS